tara:strand:- start:53167 stop:53451 length:285 start_codon:yes stop_codon:yes gene_type:complete
MINKFKEFNINESSSINNVTGGIQQIWYVSTSDIDPQELDLEQFFNDNPHNNGHAYKWNIEDPEDGDYSFPEISQYFIDNGLHMGDQVIIHCEW